VTYFTNPGPCDSTIRMTDPGTTTANGGDVCADTYVFDSAQELQECCSCPLTPDGLRTLSLKTDLLGNTLTGEYPSSGVIKILSAVALVDAPCQPSRSRLLAFARGGLTFKTMAALPRPIFSTLASAPLNYPGWENSAAPSRKSAADRACARAAPATKLDADTFKHSKVDLVFLPEARLVGLARIPFLQPNLNGLGIPPAHRMVLKHWDAIDRVAQALVERGRLEGDEVREIIDRK
jgi:hypothetical protein